MNIAGKLLLSLSLAIMPFGMAANAAPSGGVAPGVTEQGTVVEQGPVPEPAAAAGTADNAPLTAATSKAIDSVTSEDAGYEPLAPIASVGQPKDAEYYLPEMFSPTGEQAKQVNDIFLIPMMFIISIFVLGLLIYAMIRYRAKANPTPSKTSHHTVIEVVWTLVPVLILVIIAVPSIRLIAAQYETAPTDAVTVKVTGYQWYWTYTYPDHGGFEVISNMLKEKDDVGEGSRFRTDADGPKLLAVDNRMVVPAGVPLRIQTTAADVIHSFAVPSLWFKLDAVPGRLNERTVTVEKPGVYYGQCSELCGARHAFMPIVVEALPPARFAAWVRAQGGSMPDEDTDRAGVVNQPQVDADEDIETAGEDAAVDDEVETVPALR